MRKICLVFLIGIISASVKAQLKLPTLVSDSMVLQRDQPVKVWGWSLNGAPVTVSFMGKEYKTRLDKDNKWTVDLPAMKAGGPFTMTIKTDDADIKVKEILVGDVWLCSGQSNMEFALYRAASMFPNEIPNSANTNIREFHVNQVYSFLPKNNVEGSWKPASPANTGKFTAVGYFMAKALYEKYKVPIGIIHSSWGGTPAESWTSEEGLKDFKEYTDKADYFKDAKNVAVTIEKDKEIAGAWYKELNEKDKGLTEKWADPAFNTSLWRKLQLPGNWEYQGAADVDGVVWIKKEIELTEDMIKQDATLDLGLIDDADYTYFNGQQVGTTNNKYVIRKYRIPASLMKKGKNVIVVRIIDTDGNGGFVKNKKYSLTAGGSELSLEGAWQYDVACKMDALPYTKFTKMQNQPTSLYNGMIAPLIPYTIKGAAWYQGESNVGRAMEYRTLLPAMIADWRNSWQQGNFPFLIVQLANFQAVNSQPEESSWAQQRESQLLISQQVPNSALAVAIDVGEPGDVHPLNKKAVGDRLALAAEKLAYGEPDIVYSGPTYQSMTINGNKITLSFTNTGSGLVARGGELKRFAIAGEDRKFVWATATIQHDKIVVWSDAVPNPVAVRYAWANNPEGSNLYNKEDLPASPFRTDAWTKDSPKP